MRFRASRIEGEDCEEEILRRWIVLAAWITDELTGRLLVQERQRSRTKERCTTGAEDSERDIDRLEHYLLSKGGEWADAQTLVGWREDEPCGFRVVKVAHAIKAVEQLACFRTHCRFSRLRCIRCACRNLVIDTHTIDLEVV